MTVKCTCILRLVSYHAASEHRQVNLFSTMFAFACGSQSIVSPTFCVLHWYVHDAYCMYTEFSPETRSRAAFWRTSKVCLTSILCATSKSNKVE